MEYRLVPISDVDFNAYVDSVNEAYSDYFVPLHVSPESMQGLIFREDLDIDRSRVAIDSKGNILGSCMLGIRDNRGWIGVMGVVPEYRRKGIGRVILKSLIENAQQLSLKYLTLEVITQNVGAFDLYQTMGFEKLRTLVIFDRGVMDVSTRVPGEFSVVRGKADDVLQYYDQFHEVENPWQRQKNSLECLMESWSTRLLTSDGSVVGYVGGWFGPERVQVWDAGISPDIDNREEAAQALLASVLQEFPKATSGMLNVGEDDIIVQPMQALGYRQTLRQYEMRLVINEI
ncbi:MAG: GNAT family N-acetyltransferase [Chloroflexi bacterium]|nr:GNAT family N-acetyltransferase [Chloroflexota bacterium]